jgi:hypothetical protein
LETMIAGIWIPEVSSPPFSSLSLFLFLPFPSLRAPPSSPLRARGPWPHRVQPPPPSRRGSPAPGAAPLPPGAVVPALGGAPLGVAPCARLSGPGARPLPSVAWTPDTAAARVLARLARPAWPRAPRSPNAFPRAQPHARGDGFLVLINFKLCLGSVLCRALHLVTNLFNFRFY